MKKILLAIISAAYSSILWLLQEVTLKVEPKTVSEIVGNFLYDHKFIIFVASTIIFIGSQIFILPSSKWKKKMVQKQLNFILDQYRAENLSNVRITVMKAEKGRNIFCDYVWNMLIHRFVTIIKDWDLFIFRLRSIPIHVNTLYLVVYERWSFPNNARPKSCVYFRTDLNDNGIAVETFTSAQSKSMESRACLDGISIPTKYTKLIGRDKTKVDQYMRDSKISPENYNSLLLMDKKANNIFATPIMSLNQSVWGVLLLDNNGNPDTQLQNIANDNIFANSIKQLTLTINTDK